MPTITEQKTLELYAHCPDARCPGYEQDRVSGTSTTTALSYVELGGDLPGFEKSFTDLAFVDGDDIPCRHCGIARLITDAPRPVYPNTSGYDQNGLLSFKGKTEAELAKMRAETALNDAHRDTELAELRGQLAALTALLAAQQQPAADPEAKRPRSPKQA